MRHFITLLALGVAFMASSLLSAQGEMSPSKPVSALKWFDKYSDAVESSQNSSKPILILFTGTNWCPACMKLEREVLNNPEFAHYIGQKFVFLKAEYPDYTESGINKSPYKPLFDRYKIDAFPTIVVVNESGEKLFTVNYQKGGPKAYVQELLQKLSMQHPQSQRTKNS